MVWGFLSLEEITEVCINSINPHISHESDPTHFDPGVFKANAKRELVESEAHTRNVLAAYTFLSEYKLAKLGTDLTFYHKKGQVNLDTIKFERGANPDEDCGFYLLYLRLTIIKAEWNMKLISASAAMPIQINLSATDTPKTIEVESTNKVHQQYARAARLFFESDPRTLMETKIRQDILPYIQGLDEVGDLKIYQDTLNEMITKLFDQVRSVSCPKFQLKA